MSDYTDRLNERTQDPEAIERRIVAHWRRGGFRERTLRGRKLGKGPRAGYMVSWGKVVFLPPPRQDDWVAGWWVREGERRMVEAQKLNEYASQGVDWTSIHLVLGRLCRASVEDHLGYLQGLTEEETQNGWIMRNTVVFHADSGVESDREGRVSRWLPDWPGAVQRLGEVEAMEKLNNDVLRRTP